MAVTVVSLVLLLFITFLPSRVHASDDVIRQEGDVMLAAIFEVNERDSNGGCGAYDLQGMRTVYALQWFIDTLNAQNYVPGVKIGLETRRVCRSHARAVRHAAELMDTYVTNSTNQPPLIGIVGPSTTTTAMAVSQLFTSLPESFRVPQISGSATGSELGNKTNYPSFFRVIPPDGTQIMVITDLLLKLHWNYIAIIYVDDEYGRAAAAALLQEAALHDICVPVFAPLPTDPRTDDFNEAVESIVNNLNRNPSAGVSSAISGVVFVGATTAAQRFVVQLNGLSTSVEIIFSEALGLQASALKTGNTVIGVAKGALTVTPLYREVNEFRESWNNLWTDCSNLTVEALGNRWLAQLGAAHQADCTAQLQLAHRDQMLFIWYHLQAASVFAAVMKSLHSAECGHIAGTCPGFLARVRDYVSVRRVWDMGVNLEEEFYNVSSSFVGLRNVSFDSNGEVVVKQQRAQATYEVHNFRTCVNDSGVFCFVLVGRYTDGNLALDNPLIRGYDSNGNPVAIGKANCRANCLECIPRKLSDLALVVPGDFYFVAFAPVHSRDPENALECGEARDNLGADFVQAILFALDEVNKPGGRWHSQLPSKKLGAVIFDSCFSQLSVQYKMLNLHKGQIMTPSGPMDEEDAKNLLKRIAGYIGGFFSVTSFGMSRVLTGLDLKAYVHLSPTSVSQKLSDREQHPFFLRLTGTAFKEILAMIEMLQQLSVTYVQILYDPEDAYSADLTKEFENKATEFDVCVAQTIKVTLSTNPAVILSRLRQMSSARMVIVILQYAQILTVMDYLIGDGSRLKEEDNFIFLGSEAWARRMPIVEGRQRLSGSITVAEEIAVDLKFTDYFRNVDPVNTSNFWLQDYWESRADCYFDLSFRREGKSRECTAVMTQTYSQDPWLSYYIQSVYAFATGVGKALRDNCPTDSDGVCSYITAQAMVDEMKKVRLDLFSTGHEQRVFDDNGDGENGYKFMQAFWDRESRSMTYRQIGTWTAGGGLSLSVTVADLITKLPTDVMPKNYHSSCSNEVECRSCPSSQGEAPPERPEKTLPMMPAVVAIAVLSVLVVVLVVIVVVAVVRYCRRPRRARSRSPSCPAIHIENEAMSTLSSLGHGNQPIQEMYAHSGSHHNSNDDTCFGASDYATVGASIPDRPPPPCSSKGNSDYLTAVCNDRPAQR